MELKCLYDNELSPKEIFNSMKKNIYDHFSSISFISISKEYLAIRYELFNLIKRISNKMGFKSQTYFLSVYYLDILFSQNKKIDCNHHTLGLACLLLSAKYCENDPAVPELKYFIKLYNRYIGSKNSISVSDLFYSEVIACKMLNHKLNYYTVYDFNSFFFTHNILKKEQLDDLNIDYRNDIKNRDNKYNKITGKERKIMEKIYKKSRYYLDIIIESPICLKYNSLLLSIYTMKKSIEFILLNEQKYDKYDLSGKDLFLKKTNDCFNSIIKGYYDFDYENLPEYQKLIEEYDFIKIFKTIKKEKKQSDYNYTFSSTKKSSENSTSLNKTPSKRSNGNLKSLNQRISEINYTSTKKNFPKLKSSINIHSKVNSINSFVNFSGKDIPRVSFHQNKNINLGPKVLYRNLGIDNCNENYRQEDRENILSEKKANKSDNRIVYIFRLNSQSAFGNRLKFSDRKKINTNASSPFKFSILDKSTNSHNLNNEIKRENLFKKTKTKDFDKKIYSISNDKNKSISKDKTPNINNSNNITNANITSNKPYYKKVVQNCGNKLKNFNQISNKLNNNLDNNNNKEITSNTIEKNEEKKNMVKPAYNVVNRVPKYKIIKNKEEKASDIKGKISLNKKYNITIKKDSSNTITNTKKEYTEYNYNNYNNYNNNKNKKISQLLHINLNPKLSYNNNSNATPLASLFVNKKNDDFFLSSSFNNKTNAKKKNYEAKTLNLAKSIDTKINNSIKSNNLNKKLEELFSKQGIDSNRYKDDNNYEKRNYNYLYDSNDLQENIISNTLTTSLRGTRQTVLNIKKDRKRGKENELDINSRNNNKIMLTDYTLSGEENINEDGDLTDDIGNINRKFKTKTITNQPSNKYKRIHVKKNKAEYDYYNTDNEEKYKNYKIIKSQNLGTFKGYLNKRNDYRNFEENNDEDSNNISQRKYYLYAKKNKQREGENNLIQQYKKNPSTIVINNNININFGNKTNLLKDKKRYKNLIKNSQIQINNNNGPNSISTLLHKIPLCYNNQETNINVNKNNFININNK